MIEGSSNRGIFLAMTCTLELCNQVLKVDLSVKFLKETILVLRDIITGDGNCSPSRSGPQLVEFFNQFGSNDEYGRGFPARKKYAEEKLREFNDKLIMKDILLAAIDPRHFWKEGSDNKEAVELLNKYLEFDNYKLQSSGNNKWDVSKLDGSQIELSHPYENSQKVTHIFIDEQISKCDDKIAKSDFDGAITNARSLVEAVLLAIEQEFDPNPSDYKVNLPERYKRVQKHLNLSPGQENLAKCLKEILNGLTKIVNGLATLRNNMSDAHARSYQPSEHHARLAVNSAKTLCHFLFATKEYQMQKNNKPNN
ncbi:abortive infection family protein [Moorena sp. SIO1F2]|uniref:abortive infection family protein n=1 Tax=Moorena sp. SIO1F2 TaxID=2607819 RepID=UPI0025E78E49|nr:abortive infection family protein [Moorena sp. SIO1F2]